MRGEEYFVSHISFCCTPLKASLFWLIIDTLDHTDVLKFQLQLIIRCAAYMRTNVISPLNYVIYIKVLSTYHLIQRYVFFSHHEPITFFSIFSPCIISTINESHLESFQSGLKLHFLVSAGYRTAEMKHTHHKKKANTQPNSLNGVGAFFRCTFLLKS